MHVPARRTVLGVSCLYWALVLDLALVAATFVVSVAVVPGFFMALEENRDPAALAIHLPCMVVFLSVSILFGLSTLILFFAGFHDVYVGRGEFGREQERRVFRARLSLGTTIALAVGFVLLPRERAMLIGMPDEVVSAPPWALVARLVLSVLVAFFVGLTLYNSVYGLADRFQRSRLRRAVALGTVAALAGSVFGAVGLVSGTPELMVLAILSGAIAGEGTAALSLVTFLLVFREIGRSLEKETSEKNSSLPSHGAKDPGRPFGH